MRIKIKSTCYVSWQHSEVYFGLSHCFFPFLLSHLPTHLLFIYLKKSGHLYCGTSHILDFVNCILVSCSFLYNLWLDQVRFLSFFFFFLPWFHAQSSALPIASHVEMRDYLVLGLVGWVPCSFFVKFPHHFLSDNFNEGWTPQ